jgi:hypothetical protein
MPAQAGIHAIQLWSRDCGMHTGVDFHLRGEDVARSGIGWA